VREVAHTLRGYARIGIEMQELWLLTRIRRDDRKHPVKRLNPFSLDRLEHDPALTAYWRRTRRVVARLELWRLNPLVLTWNLVRGTRQALAFLVALHGERY
jgi:hypothetical protein